MANWQTYELDFSEKEWDELVSMSFAPFEFGEGDALTRGQWLALAHMAMGKAERIDRGDYGGDTKDDGFDPIEWAEELREIADKILVEFQPGDGKL